MDGHEWLGTSPPPCPCAGVHKPPGGSSLLRLNLSMKYSSSYASGMYTPRLRESSKGLPQIFHFAKLDDSLPVFRRLANPIRQETCLQVFREFVKSALLVIYSPLQGVLKRFEPFYFRAQFHICLTEFRDFFLRGFELAFPPFLYFV